jgi:RNA polymerase sigma-70 factor (ECF subfamily)
MRSPQRSPLWQLATGIWKLVALSGSCPPRESCYDSSLVDPLRGRSTCLQPEQAQTTDVELLKAIARKDETALGEIYDRYRGILFGLMMRILNNREEAEDVLQEVFLQVWRRAVDFDQQRGRPFTWLVTLARSRAIDRLRSLAARDRVAIAGAREASDRVSDAASDAFHSERRGLVTAALAQLPDEQKRALMLAYFDGLTQSEIASRLKTPLGTVKTRMRSGMIKLRQLLAGKSKSFGF